MLGFKQLIKIEFGSLSLHTQCTSLAQWKLLYRDTHPRVNTSVNKCVQSVHLRSEIIVHVC